MRWALGRRPALDGLRGLAIVMVMAGHAVLDDLHHSTGALAPAGLEVFFALSGFLITALLLEEVARTGRVSLVRFYGRRARRLFPALALMLAGLTVVSRFTATDITPLYWPTILYVANWVALAGHPLGVLNATWSLSVEEQFYLAWPALLLCSLRWRRGPEILGVSVIVASAVVRYSVGGDHAYFGTDSQAGALIVGATLAVAAHRGLPALRLPAWSIGLMLVPLVACYAWRSDYAVWLPLLVPLWTVILIWASCSGAGGPLGWAWLRYVGRRSYGLYLWHYPLLWLAWIGDPGSVVAVAVALTLAFALAELSWQLAEAPALRWSIPDRRRRPAPITSPVAHPRVGS